MPSSSFVFPLFLLTASLHIWDAFQVRQPTLHQTLSRSKSSVSRIKSSKATSVLASSIEVDVVVIGGGIAGSTISWLLQERENLSVALIDPNGEKEGTWYPNYGEWRDEWHSISDTLELPELKECTTTEWESTDTFFGGSNDVPMEKKTELPRAYVRVDRIKLQRLLRGRYKAANGITIPSKLSSTRISPNLFDKGLVHSYDGSELSLDDGTSLKCKIVVDASGLESRLVGKETPATARGSDVELETGYQIAYGFLATVDSMGPYNNKTMTLFDYRTDHLTGQWLDDGVKRPTFMYVMPLSVNDDGTTQVFWEETSLVGRGERRLSFQECKKRAYRRLEHHGINVLGVEEEEFCYIPMGGELPDLSQRVVGFGGAANMAHPATGYQANRALTASATVSKAIGHGLRDQQAPDRVAADAYVSMWSQQNRNQRDFQVFGGDFLMQQPVAVLRGFFSAFFAIEQDVWAGFLAGWPGLPGNEYHETWDKRISFALNMFGQMPNDVRLAMISYAIRFTFEKGPNVLLRSITPGFIFGAGPPDLKWSPPVPASEYGDPEAKQEAREMIAAFTPSNTVTPSDGTASSAPTEEVLVRSGGDFPAPFTK